MTKCTVDNSVVSSSFELPNGVVVEKGQDKQPGNQSGMSATIGGESIFYNPRTHREGTLPQAFNTGTLSDGTAPTC